MLRTTEIELCLSLTVDGKFYELDGFQFEADYEIDGEDAPATWGYYGGEPATSAAWLVYHLKLEDQDQIDAYNADAVSEGYDPIPWKAGEDIWSLLTEAQQGEVEHKVEQEDREYNPY